MKRILTKGFVSRFLFWVLLVLSAVSFLFTSVLGIVKYQLANPAFYCRVLADRRVDDALYELICEEIKQECDFNAFPSEVILNSVSKESVASSKNKYFIAFFTDIFSGKKSDLVKAEYNGEKIMSAIENYASSDPEAEKLYQRRENRELLAANIQTIIEEEIGSVSSGMIGKMIRKIQPKLAIIATLSRFFLYFLFFEVAVLALLFWLLIRSKMRYLYSVSLFHFAAADLLFIPFLILAFYRLPERLALDENAMLLYFRSVWDRFVMFGALFFGFFAFIFLGLLVFSVFYQKRMKTPCNETERNL